MTKDQIKLGGIYLAKVTDKVVPVRIDRDNPHGGWDATNLTTNKKVRIKSAQRLRPRSEPTPARTPAPDPDSAPAAPPAGGQERQAGQRARAVAEVRAADAAANAGAAPTGTPAPARSTKPRKPAEPKARKTSGLDAAAQVLQEAGHSLAVGDIVKAIFDRRLWNSGGKTPGATLHAAMTREIARKGAQARFVKVQRGQFAFHAASH